MADLAHHPDVRKVAEQVLSGSGVTPPEHLLDSLSDLLDARPEDILFKIISEPEKGFGKVECLEAGCMAKKKIISLLDYPGLKDGGKSIGIGSLDLFTHHQRESPAHKKCFKARSSKLSSGKGTSTSLAASSSQADVKPSIAASSSSSNASRKEKKHVLVEISDDDDDIVILPNKNKPALSSSQGSSSSQKSAISIPSFGAADKGKGRAPLEKTGSLSSVDNKNNISRQIMMEGAGGRKDPSSELTSSAFKRARLSDLADDDSGMDVDRSDRASSADSDLIDLSTRFNIKPSSSKPASQTHPVPSRVNRHENITWKPMLKRERTISNENDPSARSRVLGGGSTGRSAYDDFKALTSGMNVDVKPGKEAARKSASFNAIRDEAPPTSSSPAAFKDDENNVGMDSGYMSSINTSSSSPMSKMAAAAALRRTASEGSGIKSEMSIQDRLLQASASGSTSAAASGTPKKTELTPLEKATITKYEDAIKNGQKRLAVLLAEMRFKDQRTAAYKSPKMEYDGLQRNINNVQAEINRINASIGIAAKPVPPMSSATPAAAASSFTAGPSTAAGTSSSVAGGPAAIATQLAGATPADIQTIQQYERSLATYKTSLAGYQARLKTEKKLNLRKAIQRHIANTNHSIRVYEASLNSLKRNIACSLNGTGSSTPTTLLSAQELAAKAAEAKYQQALTKYQAALIIFSKEENRIMQNYNGYKEKLDGLKRLCSGPSELANRRLYQPTIDRVEARIVEITKELAAHRRTRPVLPQKPAVAVAAKPPTPQQSFQSMIAEQLKKTFSDGPSRLSSFDYGGTGGNSYGDDSQGLAFLAGGGVNPYAWGKAPAAGPSGSNTAGAHHTANLGPTGLAVPAAGAYLDPYGGLYDSDDEMPFAFRQGIEEYSGGHRVYTESETLSFFNDAAAGYDFSEEGEKALDEALVTIGLEKTTDYFPETNIQPYAHQILGIAWMLNQEKVKTKIRGGILADDMGLGKTIQTISLIHLHKAKEDDKPKATLVLAPVALLEQWKNEIDNYTKGKMSVYIYHGPGRKITKKELQKYDVVVSTTNTMALEWEECDDIARGRAKKAAKKANKEWTEDDEADWYEKASEQMKPLFTIKWRRCVIDEAQNIRNRETRVSRASTYLDANYRWCLTGTPVTNTLTDIYSLLRFLKIAPWSDWTKWRDHVYRIEKKSPELASKRVQAILKLCLLRRNKDSELNGKRLLNLKPMHIHEMAVFLTEDERAVYDYIEGKSQQQINKYIREGTIMKNYAHILVLLLRLRQCVGHPALVTESFLNSAHTAVEDPVADRAAAHATVVAKCGQDKLESMLKRRLEFAKQRFEDEQAKREIQMEECPICMEPLDASALVTPCGHTFCPCFKGWIDAPETAAQNPEGYADDERPCPNCRQKLTKTAIFTLKYFEPTKEELAEITGTEVTNDEAEFENEMAEYLKKKNITTISTASKREGKRASRTRAAKSRAAKRRIVKDSEDDEDFIDDTDAKVKVKGYTKKTGAQSDSEAEVDEIESEFEGSEAEESDDGDIKDFLRTAKDVKVKELGDDVRDKYTKKSGRQFIPSAKMEAMVKIIKESPKEDKIMIISQWTSMLSLVEVYLNELGINWITFRGDMKRSDRDTAVKRFNESKKVKCMLMSLKAGGVGLNMTGGNRAILLDLAWSPAVEAQAFCRMHRLGQKKEVFVERCIVAGTVEDRILTLQEHKKKLADHSLGEGTGEKLKKFGVEDIKMLFGMGAEQGYLASQWVHPDVNKGKKITAGAEAGPSNATGPVAGPSNTTGTPAGPSGTAGLGI